MSASGVAAPPSVRGWPRQAYGSKGSFSTNMVEILKIAEWRKIIIIFFFSWWLLAGTWFSSSSSSYFSINQSLSYSSYMRIQEGRRQKWLLILSCQKLEKGWTTSTRKLQINSKSFFFDEVLLFLAAVTWWMISPILCNNSLWLKLKEMVSYKLPDLLLEGLVEDNFVGQSSFI